ncbi:MAG: GNAT family N-acetyltransferase [Beijerinckiaceae bacterium]|nr:GNAT family N-acetyltransferase [Beijerinckiaceae bacterium]MCI0737358.1 GNAT family N-acetyltransferase [Beijerinckiaceae bacterium]
METDIGVVCAGPSDRQSLIDLRKWERTEREELEKCGTRARVWDVSPLSKAMSWRNELPDDRLVVMVGFRREEIEDCRFPLARSGEPIILCVPDAATMNNRATASFFNNPAIVPCKDIIPFVKKSLIRSSLRKQVQIRPPISDAEWAGYFSLRYRVWEECNFLRDENKRARTKWEIDWKDRTAIPLCAITPAGKVVGCARVLKSHGQEEQPYVSQITNLLIKIGDGTLQKLFSFPRCAKEPFDLLMEFPGFRAHYAELIKNRKEPAEISRVAIDPEYRGRSLTEALVDTAVSRAEARHFSPIILACQERHARLYSKCGFVSAKGITSDKYLNIQLPVIVMERTIK